MNSISPGAAAQSARSIGERALAHFLAAGFVRMEPPILHPAAVFLDMSGEEIRGRLFLTSGASGDELCLRPEYTIPVCRAYLSSDRCGKTAEYAYLGPVFRAQAEGGERAQTGLESFGRKDAEAADAEIFALAMESASDVGGPLAARLGDAGLFDSLLEALALPDVWRRRLRRGVARGRSLSAILDGRGASALAQPGVLAALESADHAGAKALVEDLLAIAGIDAVGGRTAGEIADRFLEQAALRSGEPIDADKRELLESYLAVADDPDEAASRLRQLADDAETRPRQGAGRLREAQRLHRGPGRPDPRDRFQRGLRARFRLLHRLRLRRARSDAARRETCPRRWPLRRARPASRRSRGHPGRRRRDRRRPAVERERALMASELAIAEPPFVLAVPSKGRLQESAAAFFARAGLEFQQGRGARDYRGALMGLPGVEVAYLSSAEIVGRLAAGAAHFGVTGEDLLREKVADAEARLELLAPLGFGRANVVVATPQAWIDVRTMADLEDVASAFSARRGERMRVATKYVNLTRRFFAEHGVADYRIVESLGATEGAPAAGAAELIVDITTTGATLKANALKPLDDGIILRSQATLVASMGAPWGRAARASARAVLDRIAASEEAQRTREVRARLPGPAEGILRTARETFDAVPATGEDADLQGFVALHCARADAAELAGWLLAQGADRVSVAALEQVFDARNPLFERLEGRIGRGEG